MNKTVMIANELSDSEIYAPIYKTGTHVSVHPIPIFPNAPTVELVVSNRNPNVQARYENYDIIAINFRVAEKLGIDFTGDLISIEPINK